MHHKIIKQHDAQCLSHPDNLANISPKDIEYPFAIYCEYNPVRFVFLANSEFYIIEFYECMFQSYRLDKYEFIKELITKSIDKSFAQNYFKVERGVCYNYRLKKRKERELVVNNKHIHEINYEYQNAAGKPYRIVTFRPVVDIIIEQDKLKKEYQETVKYIDNNGLDFMKPNIESLYASNRYYSTQTDIEVYHTVNQMIRSINEMTSK